MPSYLSEINSIPEAEPLLVEQQQNEPTIPIVTEAVVDLPSSQNRCDKVESSDPNLYNSNANKSTKKSFFPIIRYHKRSPNPDDVVMTVEIESLYESESEVINSGVGTKKWGLTNFSFRILKYLEIVKKVKFNQPVSLRSLKLIVLDDIQKASLIIQGEP
jgi:hypothetical protein